MSTNEWPEEEKEEIDPEEIKKIVDDMLSQEDEANAFMELIHLEDDSDGEIKVKMVRGKLNETEEGKKLLSNMSRRIEENKRHSEKK